VTWICLATREKDAETFLQLMKVHPRLSKIPAKSCTLAEVKKHIREKFAIVVTISEQWPKGIDGNGAFVWLPTQKTWQRESADFVVSWKEFQGSPEAYLDGIEHIARLKVRAELAPANSEPKLQRLEARLHDLEQANERLRQLSVTDDLTLVYNHRYFRQALEDETERSRRYRTHFSLFLIDVDHFKKFNDEYGHLIGDKVLVTIAQVLQESVRRVDSVCRYGGEEFAIILPMTLKKFAMDLAERVRQRIFNCHETYKLPVGRLSVSIGVATFPDDAETSEKLVAAADRALYQAKDSGRNCVASAPEMIPS
jgi:diguanylate cyclase (GGDEF)-like protein